MKGISKSVCVLVLSWLISGTFKTEGYSSSYTEISTEGLSTTEFVTWWSTSIDTTSRYLTTDVPETSSEHSTTVERSTTPDVTTEEITTEGVSTTADWPSTTTEEDTTTEAIISTTIDWPSTTTKEDTTTEAISTTIDWTSTATEEDTTTEETLTTTDVVSTTIKSTERYETTTLPTSTQDVTSTVARPATTFLSTSEVATSTQPMSSTQSTSTSVPTSVGTSRSTEEPTSSTTKAQTSLSTDRTTSDGPSTGFTTMQQSTPTIGISPSQSAETSRPPSTTTRVTEDTSRTSVTVSEPASTDTSETTQSETPHTPIKTVTTEDVSTVTQTTDETPSDGIYTGSTSTAHITTSVASDMPSTALPMEEISEGGVVAELAVAYDKWDREAFKEAIAVSANIFCRANTSYCYIDDDGSMANITSDDVVIFYADSCANSPSEYDYTCSNVNYTLIGFYISHPTGEGVLMKSESLIVMLDEHTEDLEERLGYSIGDTVSYEELTDKEDTRSAFPGWAIFLICVGVVGAGAAAGFGVWYYLKHRHTRRKTAPKPDEISAHDGDEAGSPDAETGDSLLMEEKAAAVEDNPQNVEASEAPSVANDENIEVEADVAVIMDETKPGSD
ncbi:uncharacterized protein [Ptychodera flava]|uniref:uncharacterized protein n=1 Tax=Ptychodera flava TaxID=63121 RepID=UPI00396A4DBE